MRVKTRAHTYWIALPLILLLAFTFFLFATAVPKAAADDTIYLEADVTVGGERLPSSVVYTGAAYDFGFRLYRSTNRSQWESENDADCIDNFEILYYAVSDPDL